MKQKTSNLFILVVVCAGLVAPGIAQDNVRITGAFTTFTGTVFGGNVTFMSYCGVSQCALPGGAPLPIICPDIGCSDTTPSGNIATNFPLGSPQFDTSSTVSFWTFGNPGNVLTFTTNGQGGIIQIDPFAEFKLGTLSFTNGSWISSATFGLTVIVDDSGFSTMHGLHTFTGFVNLGLTAPPPGATPEENADFIFLTDANGVPVKNPVTLITLPSMRVYEAFDSPVGTNVGTVTLYAKLGSLDLTRMADPTGGAFLDVSLTSEPGGPPTQAAIYRICPLYDPNFAKKSGSVYPIKLQLCDATGNNLSAASIPLHAVSVSRVNSNTTATPDDAGNANPDSDFRYDATLAGYIFNLSTTGFPTGTYTLNFKAGADPVLYSAQFAVK